MAGKTADGDEDDVVTLVPFPVHTITSHVDDIAGAIRWWDTMRDAGQQACSSAADSILRLSYVSQDTFAELPAHVLALMKGEVVTRQEEHMASLTQCLANMRTWLHQLRRLCKTVVEAYRAPSAPPKPPAGERHPDPLHVLMRSMSPTLVDGQLQRVVDMFAKEVEVKALIVDRLPHQRSRDQLTYLVSAWSMDPFVDRVAIAEVLHQVKVKDSLA